MMRTDAVSLDDKAKGDDRRLVVCKCGVGADRTLRNYDDLHASCIMNWRSASEIFEGI